MRSVILLFTVFLCVYGSVSIVEAAQVSLYQRDGYDRLVIEGVSGEKIDTKNHTITVVNRGAEMKNSADILVFPSVEKIEKEGKSLTIFISKSSTDMRSFRIGDRLIVDIFLDPAAQKIKKKSSKEIIPKEKPLEKKAESAVKNSDASQAQETPIDGDVADFFTEESDSVLEGFEQTASLPDSSSPSETLDEVAEDAPEIKIVETIPPAAHPTILTISSVSPFSMAIFERYGRLFMVTEKSDMHLPPQMIGAGRELEWEIKDVPMSSGSAWVVDIPENVAIRPEGKGLIWRIVISDQPVELETSPLRRRFDDKAHVSVNIMMKETTRILKLTDPDYGDDLAVFTVADSETRMFTAYDFIDFDVLPAVVGAVVKPESDGLQVASTDKYITVSKKDGLALAPESQNAIVKAYMSNESGDGDADQPLEISSSLSRLFFFEDWGAKMEANEFLEKRQALDAILTQSKKSQKTKVLFDFVKLALSQSMGAEALGYLELARMLNTQMDETLEYQSLKGASRFLARQYDLAADIFGQDDLKNKSEARLWRTASLAAMKKNDEALDLYEENADIATIYPFFIRIQVLAPIVRAILDVGDGEKATQILELMNPREEITTPKERAIVAHLNGRAQKMTGYPEKAMKNLYIAARADKDGPYGTTSELMLVEDELAREVISLEDGIKRLERLRFVWRGDTLEPIIYKALGQLYIEDNKPRTGLSILKRAAENTVHVKERRALVRLMADVYKDMFNGTKFSSLDPLEAIAIYDEFRELTPVGTEGNQLIERLADKLMEIDLMSRTVSVLQDKMERLEGGEHAIKTGLRIAAIQLIDRKPTASMETLRAVDDMIALYDGGNKNDLIDKIILLKARSLSDMGQAEDALFITEGLNDTTDVLRLRVDTAWQSGNWVAVSDNLERLILQENMTLETPPTKAQSQMILNQAIALSLSDQYDALQQFAADYDLFMKQSPAYKTFLLVSRPSTIATLSDRETLLNLVSEVDLFQGFLESIKE